MTIDAQALLNPASADAGGLPLTPLNTPAAQLSAPQPALQPAPAPTVLQAPNWATSFLAPTPAATVPGSDSSAAQPTPAPGSFAAKLKASADQLGIPAGPGGWAKSLVASSVAALGDASAAGGYSGGAPALVGIERTMAARSQRLAQQKQQQFEQQKQVLQQQRENQAAIDQHDKDKIDMGVANAQMLHQMALAHQLGQEEIDKSIKDGVKFTEDALSAPSPARVIAKDVTHDEINKMLQDRSFDPHTQSPQATGKKEIGTDANGVPQYATTYTILSDFPEHKPTAAEAEEASRLTGSTISEGTPIPGVQWNSLQQQVSNAKTTQAALEKAKDLADIETSDRKSKLAGIQLGQIPQFTNALANNNGNPIAAEKAIMADPALRSKFPNLHSDIVAYFGGEKGYEDASKAQEHAAYEANDLIEKERHNKADEHNAAMKIFNDAHPAGGALGNIPMSDGAAKQLEQLRSVNPSAAAMIDKLPNLHKMEVLSVAYGDGSADPAKMFPARAVKGSGDLSQQEAWAFIKNANPNMDEHQYEKLRTAYKDATEGKNGIAVQQYNNFMQHAAKLTEVMTAANRQTPAIWNTALNKMENLGYGTTATSIQAAVQPVKSELELLLSQGYKPTEAESAAYSQLVNSGATPGQMSAALKVFGGTGAIRLDNINETYKRSSGNKNLPGIVAPKTLEAARTLGLDQSDLNTINALDSGGSIFKDQTPIGSNTIEQPGRPQLPTGVPPGSIGVKDPTGTTHYFPNQAAANNFKKLAGIQ